MSLAARLPAREVKRAPAALASVAADGSFSGYASLFGRVDLGRDRVLPGAFARSLAKRGAAGIRMLWQHDPAEPIGVWTAVEEDATGLFVAGRLELGVGRAREALALMRQGALDGLSIGFRTAKARTDAKSGVRDLIEVDLWEVSLVTFPMLPEARVGRVKAAATNAASSVPSIGLGMRTRLAGLGLDLAALRLAHALRQAKYDPNQPRVPAGDPDGGQWTSGGEQGNLTSGSGTNPPSPTAIASRQPSAAREAECWAQYQRDLFQCRMVGLAACYGQAAERFSACLLGNPLPPLNY